MIVYVDTGLAEPEKLLKTLLRVLFYFLTLIIFVMFQLLKLANGSETKCADFAFLLEMTVLMFGILAQLQYITKNTLTG
jgi:hypothetical protein